MKKFVLCILVVLMLVGCAPQVSPPKAVATPSPVSQELSVSEPATVKLANGFTVDIPANALSEDNILTIKVVGEAQKETAVDIVIPGPVYEVDLVKGDLFLQPVEITIPYDPALLPAGRTEAEIFAVYWLEDEGVWLRVYGEVNEEENTVTVLALHNDFWSWAASKIENLLPGFKQERQWLIEVAKKPGAIEELRNVVEFYEAELNVRWERLAQKVDYIEELNVPLEAALEAAEPPLELTLKKGLKYLAAHGLPGRVVKFVSRGVGVLAIYDSVKDTFYLIDWSKSWGEGIRLRLELEHTYNRLTEASCLLFALENPEAKSINPKCEPILTAYFRALEAKQLADRISFDPNFSAIPPLEELEVAKGPSKEPPVPASEEPKKEQPPEEVPAAEGWIVFERYNGIEKMRPDGSEVTNLMLPFYSGISGYSPAWSPDGQWIAFSCVNMDWNQEIKQEICKMRADGSKITRLTYNDVLDRDPAWSPDGQWIAFKSYGDIYKMRSDGSEITLLGYGDEPSWSPDGQWIAFTRFERYYNIYKVRVDGSQLTRLSTQADGQDRMPAWSPDGQWIAFSCGNQHWDQEITRQAWEICKMKADGSQLTRLTYLNKAWNLHPSWSPDGQWIAFQSDRHGNDQIYKVRADGSSEIRITTTFDPYHEPSWGPSVALKTEQGLGGLLPLEWVYPKDGSTVQARFLGVSGDTWSPSQECYWEIDFELYNPNSSPTGEEHIYNCELQALSPEEDLRESRYFTMSDLTPKQKLSLCVDFPGQLWPVEHLTLRVRIQKGDGSWSPWAETSFNIEYPPV